MQGNITMATAAAFLGRFFAALKENGIVDRAVAAGRRSVQDRHDWWVPVLFSRLRKGRTYYTSAFIERSDRTWASLIDAIETKRCTPVIGPGLADSTLGSRIELASRWVDRWEMPLWPSSQQSLTTVAQYLRVQTARQVPPNMLANYLVTTLREQYGSELPPEWFDDEDLERIINALGEQAQARPDDPYRVVSSLNLPIYVPSSWTGLLDERLRIAGRTPSSKYFDWRNLLPVDQTDDERPRPESPLVYHLFGRLDEPESLVLTEDDHFEWLCAWVDKRDLIPKPVSRALTRRSLLFLGYRLEDWDFRVLFQGFKRFGGSEQMRDLPHVGVQLTPPVPCSPRHGSRTGQPHVGSVLPAARRCTRQHSFRLPARARCSISGRTHRLRHSRGVRALRGERSEGRTCGTPYTESPCSLRAEQPQ